MVKVNIQDIVSKSMLKVASSTTFQRILEKLVEYYDESMVGLEQESNKMVIRFFRSICKTVFNVVYPHPIKDNSLDNLNSPGCWPQAIDMLCWLTSLIELQEEAKTMDFNLLIDENDEMGIDDLYPDSKNKDDIDADIDNFAVRNFRKSDEDKEEVLKNLKSEIKSLNE